MPLGNKKSLTDQAQDYVEQVSDTVRPQLEAAFDSAAEKAGPALAEARERAKPLIAEGKAKATEKATAGAAYAAELASAGAAYASEKAAEGAELASAKLAEARAAAADTIDPEPKKGGKLRKVLLVTGLVAVAGVVAATLRGKQESSNWQSSYVPTPPPAPKPPASTPPAPTHAAAKPSDDSAGGVPGEALSDAADEPKDVTTPDSPADVVDVDDTTEGRS